MKAVAISEGDGLVVPVKVVVEMLSSGDETGAERERTGRGKEERRENLRGKIVVPQFAEVSAINWLSWPTLFTAKP